MGGTSCHQVLPEWAVWWSCCVVSSDDHIGQFLWYHCQPTWQRPEVIKKKKSSYNQTLYLSMSLPYSQHLSVSVYALLSLLTCVMYFLSGCPRFIFYLVLPFYIFSSCLIATKLTFCVWMLSNDFRNMLTYFLSIPLALHVLYHITKKKKASNFLLYLLI